MGRHALDFAASLQAYPNIRTAAEIIGVAPSTLSRRSDVSTEGRGERDRVLSPAEVLRVATIYRKRSLNEVAQALINHARDVSEDEASRIEEEVEQFFETRDLPEARKADLLDLARRLLPPALYERVEVALSETEPALPDVVMGYPPTPES